MDKPVPNPRPQSWQQNLPVVVQPDPMLEEHGGTVSTVAMSIGALVIVVLVLYGITRPEPQQETAANIPTQATQTQPASGNAQPPKPGPSTTGQGQTQDQTGEQAKPEKSQGNPPRSDSSNTPGSNNQ